MKKPTLTLILGFVFGMALMLIINLFIAPTNKSGSSATSEGATKEKQPLYWVAPMDANYHSDKPGKSPMGMDLIPYYGDEGGGNDEGPGTIRINPDVVNNLGVRTAKAVRKPLHFEINTVGYVTFDEDKLVHVHSRIEGWIEKLYVKAVGDKVEKGQALYAIYSPSLVNAQEELLLALKRNNKVLINAAKKRLKALQLPTKAINKLIKTRKVQQNITFYAPQSGFVDKLNIRQGFFVKPAMTLMSIGDTDTIWVEAEVIESQISHISQNLPVTMQTDAIPTKIWQGQVDYVYPTLDAKKRTLKVRIKFANTDNDLKPNMFATIQIHHNENEPLLLVPSEAVIRSGKSSRVVLALGDGQFKSIEVKTGRKGDDYYEILSGIKEGEEVVTSAQFLLDSESSKTSDFKRMNHQQEQIPTATVNGVINSIMKDHRMLNISREPIEKWGRDAETLDFLVEDTVAMYNLTEGMEIMFSFEVRDAALVITSIMPATMDNNSDMGEK
jgi:Cu(I)/Ag(I) efflux system membrane fusion protein